MPTNERDFILDTNYNPLSNFARVKYGINKPLLETELNEMQKIQEDARASLIRQIVPTGFLETVRKDFTGLNIIYSPNGIENSIAIAPSKLIVNGYELTIEGKDKINGVDGYTIINIGDAPFDAVKYYNFVFMEVWFEELNSESNINKYGFIDGQIIKNNMVDDRVKDETSRRIALRYKIRVQSNVDMDKWVDGFGFQNINSYSNIYASGPKSVPIENSDYIFVSATNSMFKDTPFYGDNGLYVAGRKNNEVLNDDFGTIDNYIFGIPLFSIKRRNQKPYSIAEPNGAPKYINSIVASNRPDGLFFNRIVERDLRDLRKIISFGQMNTTKILDSGFKSLLVGDLKTKSKEVTERVQFGITPIDISSRTDVVLNVQFNKNITPAIGPIPTSIGIQKYDLCATGYGLMMDGKTKVTYKPVPLINWIDKNQGTIEFFIKPYWDGADPDVTQMIYNITDDLGNTIMSLEKDKNNLILTQKQNASSTSDINKTLVLLNNFKVNSNGIYHIRVTWDRNYNKSSIYIDGKEAGFGSYLLSALTPSTLIIGAIESITPYYSQKAGFVIDELIVYKTVLPEVFPQVDFDVASGYAKLYQSFNGVLRSFKDNYHTQRDLLTNINTIVDDTSISLEAPYDTIISVNTPKVYNSVTGVIYNGSWSGLNTQIATFNLNGSDKFNGEIVTIQYDINVVGGNGVDNIPSKVLKATINNNEIGFANEFENERKVNLINSDNTIEQFHTAFDYNSQRNGEDAYARVIRYVVESNGTNKYTIPSIVYGFKVMGIRNVDRALSKISKNMNGELLVELIDAVDYNDTFIVDLALEGYTFDYSTHSKSIVSNLLQAKIVRISAPGNTDTFSIPTNNIDGNGGVIEAFLNIYNNKNNTKTLFGTSVYLDGQIVDVDYINGKGTPFINVKFKTTPPLGKLIEIPVLTTYQPSSSDKLSIWYEYIPYQGMLDNGSKHLKRLTDWKYFCTTLGSGNVFINKIKEHSINNASNRLPGGQKKSYILSGDDIDFTNEQYSPTAEHEPNKKIRILKDATDIVENDELDSYFNILNDNITIQKMYGDHQDAKLASPLNKQGFYLTDTSPINKYLGAFCLVIDDMGNILLLVLGSIKNNPTSQSDIRATHGDLFKMESSPILMTRRY